MPRSKITRFSTEDLNTELTKEQRVIAKDAVRNFLSSPAWFSLCQLIESCKETHDVRFKDPSSLMYNSKGQKVDPMSQYGACYGVQYACETFYQMFERIITEGQDEQPKAE